MNSKRPSEDLMDLDLPTTDRDVAALRQARSAVSRSLIEALTQDSKVGAPLTTIGQRRQTSDGWEPFVLEDEA